MTFYAIGLNHLRAPVRVRERFALDAGAARRMLRTVALGDEAELILLSTCNRTEAFVYGSDADVAAVRRALSERAGTDWPADQKPDRRAGCRRPTRPRSLPKTFCFFISPAASPPCAACSARPGSSTCARAPMKSRPV